MGKRSSILDGVIQIFISSSFTTFLIDERVCSHSHNNLLSNEGSYCVDCLQAIIHPSLFLKPRRITCSYKACLYHCIRDTATLFCHRDPFGAHTSVLAATEHSFCTFKFALLAGVSWTVGSHEALVGSALHWMKLAHCLSKMALSFQRWIPLSCPLSVMSGIRAKIPPLYMGWGLWGRVVWLGALPTLVLLHGYREFKDIFGTGPLNFFNHITRAPFDFSYENSICYLSFPGKKTISCLYFTHDGYKVADIPQMVQQ